MSAFRISRRQLLSAAAVTTFAGVVSARGNFVTRGAPSRLAFLDGMLTGDDLTRARALLAPLQPRVLEHDLLWQWRRGLAQDLQKGTRAVAITRWDKAILLSGLARESALPIRQQRIGRSLFQTEIG